MFFENITYTIAFVAGLTSFFSGCVLPLIPAYFTFISGLSLNDLTENVNAEIRLKVIMSTLLFILGFSFIFIMLGALVTLLGNAVHDYSNVIRIAGGSIIILFGIHLTGIIHIKILDFDKRIHMTKRPLHLFGAFVVGMAFAAGWSPCIGPQLGSILGIASVKETVWQGVFLLSVYSAGLALPFLAISVFINYILEFLKRTTKYIRYVNLFAGIILVILGLLLLTNKIQIISIV